MAAAFLEGAAFIFVFASLDALLGQEVNSHLLNSVLIYFESSKNNLFVVFLLCAIGLQIVRCVFSYISNFLACQVSLFCYNRVQIAIFKKIYSLSYTCISKYSIGDLIDNIRTPENTIGICVGIINNLFVDMCVITAYLILLFSISLPLTISLILVFVIAGISQKVLIRKIAQASQNRAQAIVDLSTKTVQFLYAIKQIFIYDKTRDVLKKINKSIHAVYKKNIQLEIIQQSIGPLNEILGIVCVGLVMLLGVFFLLRRDAALSSSLLVFMTITYRLNGRVRSSLGIISQIFALKGPFSRMNSLFNVIDSESQKQVCGLVPEFSDSIAFNSVTFFYENEKSSCIKNINLQIPKGSVIGIVGESGAGKSSLIDLMIKLYRPTLGDIMVDGIDLQQLDDSLWRQKLGVVSQDSILFNETVAENICFRNEHATKEEIILAAKLAGAHDFIMNLSQGYETVIGEKGYRVSGGERQRISLARALIGDPEIIILDEATSNLDSHSESIIQESINALRAQKTFIIIAHRLSTIVSANIIYVLHEGEIIEEGSHKQLLAKKEHYHKLWSLQTKDPEVLATV